ncbi:MAG: flagellar type III secretion system pore protein FliP [Candidatus Eremiobacteraeota bacterium]|nr:flagellar type III secretion system pore protein FliP [Candidatus Eremiobacteraeota bacterium]
MDDLLRIAGHGHAHSALPLDVLAALTLLSLAPFVLVLSTSFVRIVVVLSLVRSALGAATLPPNTVLTGLALTLTCVVMAPTFEELQREAIRPYAAGTLTQSAFLDRASRPLRTFMERQTKARDLAVFARIAHRPLDEPVQDAPLSVLIPAFVVGELRAAFAIGLALYLPFVAIDLAVAAILMGVGMVMLSPPVISLPCKLLLFVMVDGWALVCNGVVQSFR